MGNLNCCSQNDINATVEDSNNIATTSIERHLIRHRRQNPLDVYHIVELVGEGSISNIYKIRRKDTSVNKCGGSSSPPSRPKSRRGIDVHRKKRKETALRVFEATRHVMYALKGIDLALVNEAYLDEMRNEIEIMKNLDHPNIVKAYETFSFQNRLSIIMELCTGGDLYMRQPYTEKEAAGIVGKLLSAIAYMHSKNITHRDIKFENIMFESTAPDAEIKLIDFGLSTKFLAKEFLRDRVGTIYTMSPEVIRGEYTSKADMWAVGVVSYMLLCGERPFWASKKSAISRKIVAGKYSMEGPLWDIISKEAIAFVSSLLRVNSAFRLTAEKALEHEWLAWNYQLSDRTPADGVLDNVHENIFRYAEQSQFKKLALMVIAHASSSAEIVSLRKAFDQYDRNNQGSITLKEFKEALIKYGHNEKELVQLFKKLDVNNNGLICWTEFLAATLEAQGRLEEQRLAEAFYHMDSDESGFISRKNLREILGDKIDNATIDKLIDDVDQNNDGQISYEEFLEVFQSNRKNEVACLCE